MAPRTDPYTLQMKNLHQRYGLTKNIMQLFTALDNHHRGVGDPDALGRWLRMSPHMRKACTDTISSLAESMRKTPTPDCVVECTALISSCTEMLKLAKDHPLPSPKQHYDVVLAPYQIEVPVARLEADVLEMARATARYSRAQQEQNVKGARPDLSADHVLDEPKQETFFPFMRLPAEIRQRIYKFYFRSLFTLDKPGTAVIIPNTRSSCSCPPHENWRTRFAPRISMPLCHAARVIKDEVLAAWYESQMFHFACCCDLREHLHMSASLRYNLRSLKVHWTGPMSDQAFKLLKQVSTLKSLTIEISKSTTNCVSEREASALVYFKSRPARLCDALGYDELVSLRGLKEVEVEHVQGRQALRRTHEERMGLERALEAHIKAPSEE